MAWFLRLFPLLVFLGFVGTASAQEEPQTVNADQQGAEWEQSLQAVEAYATGSDHTPEKHAQFNAHLENIKQEATDVISDTQEEMASLTRLLEALGPAPAEGDAPEPAEIKKKREDFNTRISVLRSRIAEAELTKTRAADLEVALSTIVREEFRQRMLVRSVLPLAPHTVETALPEFLEILASLGHSYSEWRAGLSSDQYAEVRWRGAIVLFVAILAFGIRRFLLKRYGRRAAIEQPTYSRRFVAAIAEACARGIVPASFFAVPLILIPLGLSVTTGLFADVFSALCKALVLIILGVAITRAFFAPDLPNWRLTHMGPDASRVLSRRVIFLIVVFGLDVFFDQALCMDCDVRTMAVSREMESLYSFIVDSLEAVGIVLLMQGRLWRTVSLTPSEEETGEQPGGSPATPIHVEGQGEALGDRVWMFGRRAVGALAVLGVGATLIGYVNLGDRLTDGLMLSGVILGALYLIRRLLRELTQFALGSSWLGFRENSRDLLFFWLCVILDFFLLLVAVYATLPIWGVPRTDLTRWIADLLEGVTVGGVTISFVDILTAMLVFVLVVTATRLIRQTLSEKVLAKTNLDTGIRNSLASGVSYVGITIAALVAVGIMGFNFQNIAIVAGALSVGIGFGLQNIVNNFVSGLILLVERPIKIGDWVVVGEHQGFVRRINVRATEIETFDRAAVILPNSDLLSTAVMNWTHKDKTGRLIIMIGVAYGSDTERVREILLSCSKDHSEILNWPQPIVLFQNFGGSSLDFELRAYLRDVGSRLSVSSELRFAIDKAFREEGIEIPFAQHDIHLRDIERLEQALAALKPETRAPASTPVPPQRPVEESGA